MVGLRKLKRIFLRSTIVKFDQYKQREHVYQKGKNLPANGGHRIKENFSRESDKQRGLLFPIMKLAREKGYYSKLEGNRLIVRDRVSVNVTCTVDTLDKLPQDLSPEKLFTPTKDGVTLFYTLFSPHSNFYQCDFTDDDGIQYNCVEQFLVYKNFLSVGNNSMARKVLGVSDPAVIKSMGRDQFNNLDNDIKMNHMKQGMQLKYKQNERLKELLKDTGSGTLAESNPFDLFWGTGKRITDSSAFDRNWEGQNMTGRLLMEVRTELASEEDWE